MRNSIANRIHLHGRCLWLLVIILALAAGASAKGRKFGLFVGINEYRAVEDKLNGCVNDALKMRSTMIAKFGFSSADTTLLTDAQASRAAIIAKIRMYENLAGPGDLFLFHYSGHGTLFPDVFSEVRDETKEVYMEGIDEETGKMVVFYPRGRYDSALVPVDADERTSGKRWRNLILDDELYEMFSAFTRKGVHVVFVSDSCHSGSIAKAPKTDAKVRMLPLIKVFGVKNFDDLQLTQPAESRSAAGLLPVKGMYIALTGSRDDEFSLDSRSGGIPMGLFTSTLVSTLNTPAAAKMTYAQLMAAVSAKVARSARNLQNDQNPQLDSRFGNPNSKVFAVPPAKSGPA